MPGRAVEAQVRETLGGGQSLGQGELEHLSTMPRRQTERQAGSQAGED